METQAPPKKPPLSLAQKVFRLGCGCFVLFVGAILLGPVLLIGARDHERQRACDEGLGNMVTRQITLGTVDVTGGGTPLTLEVLRTDETWTTWSSYADDIAAHVKAGGQARLVWTNSDTNGVLLFDKDGRAVGHVCFVT